MPRIYITVTPELQRLIKRYSEEFDISEARAASELAAIGARVQFPDEDIDEAVPSHGGFRTGAGRKALEAAMADADLVTDYGRNDPAESDLRTDPMAKWLRIEDALKSLPQDASMNKQYSDFLFDEGEEYLIKELSDEDLKLALDLLADKMSWTSENDKHGQEWDLLQHSHKAIQAEIESRK